MSSVARTAVVATLLTASALIAPAAAQRAIRDSAGDGVFSLALTGDTIITRRLSPYREPEFLRLIEFVRDADAAFTNLEVLFHDYEGFPMNESGGTCMRADPALAAELTWAGFDLAGMANNHRASGRQSRSAGGRCSPIRSWGGRSSTISSSGPAHSERPWSGPMGSGWCG